MNLEERLEVAKSERLLSKAPILRRVIFRSRLFATIGGIGMAVSAIREIAATSSFDEFPLFTRVIPWVLLVIAILMLITTRGIKKAAETYRLAELPRRLGRLQALIAIVLVSSLISFGVMVNFIQDLGGDVPPLAILMTLIQIVIIAIWLKDIHVAKEEIAKLRQSGECPAASDIPSGKPRKLSTLLLIAFGCSAALSAVLTGLLHYGYESRNDWMTEHFTGKAVSYIEPFNVFSKLTEREAQWVSEIDVSPEPADAWTRWMTAEFEKQSGQPSPYSVEPYSESQDSLETRKAAFAAYESYLADHPEVLASVSAKCNWFNALSYFAVFASLGTVAAFMLRRPETRPPASALEPG